jgi:hypothetical protein
VPSEASVLSSTRPWGADATQVNQPTPSAICRRAMPADFKRRIAGRRPELSPASLLFLGYLAMIQSLGNEQETETLPRVPMPRGNDMTAEEREQWLATVAAMRSAIDEREEENLKATRETLSDFEIGLTALHGVHMGLWQAFNGRRRKNAHHSALAMLTFRAANDLLASWCLISRGYYVAANGVFRAVWEGALSAAYVHHFPEDAELWWKMEPTRAEVERLRVGQMRRRLEEEGKIDKEFREFYGTLSAMTHPTADSMYPGIVVKESAGERQLEVAIVGRFEKKKSLYHAAVAVLLGISVARMMAEVLPGSVGEEDSPYSSRDELEESLLAIEHRLGLDKDILALTPEEIYGFRHDSEP